MKLLSQDICFGGLIFISTALNIESKIGSSSAKSIPAAEAETPEFVSLFFTESCRSLQVDATCMPCKSNQKFNCHKLVPAFHNYTFRL